LIVAAAGGGVLALSLWLSQRVQTAASGAADDAEAAPAPSAPSDEWKAPHAQAMKEGRRRTRELVDDALKQAESRSDTDPAYLAQLRRMRAELDAVEQVSSDTR
jgi:hypothetical protein